MRATGVLVYSTIVGDTGGLLWLSVIVCLHSLHSLFHILLLKSVILLSLQALILILSHLLLNIL